MSENLVPPTRDIGNQEQDQSSLGDLPQIQTRIDIKKKKMLNYRLRLFESTVSPTLCYAAGTWTPSKEHEKNDSIDATQDATTHHPDKKKIQKIEKQDTETKDEKGIV